MILSGLVFLPLIYAVLVYSLPIKWTRPVSLACGFAHFILSLGVLWLFNPQSSSLQLVENVAWIPSLGINYFLGIDGLSIWLVLLTTFLTPVTILGSWHSIEKQSPLFHVCLFALQTTMLGTFLAMDTILFYVFFEASLIPMYLMIGIWGGARRLYATVKFFIYTMFGSLFMLVAILALIQMTGEQNGGALSASLLDFYKLDIPFVANDFFNTQTLLFFSFALAFAIKVPMFPFHTWLPDAHVEAPTPGSVILAGVMLKMGTYGFLRLCLPLFPEAVEYWAWLFILLGVFGIIYGALVAMVQPDIKKLVAYSSVSHMGYVVVGLFSLNQAGVTGALYQMLNHGISTGALFLLVGMMYERTHSRELSRYGGLANRAPIYTIFFLIVTFSSIAVPLTNGFVGEFLILLGLWLKSKAMAAFAVSGVVLGAVYMLWLVKKMFFGAEGELVRDSHKSLDLNLREVCVLVPLVIMIFWMGIAPGQFLKFSKSSIELLVNSKSEYQLGVMDGQAPGAVAKVLELKPATKESGRGN